MPSPGTQTIVVLLAAARPRTFFKKRLKPVFRFFLADSFGARGRGAGPPFDVAQLPCLRLFERRCEHGNRSDGAGVDRAGAI